MCQECRRLSPALLIINLQTAKGLGVEMPLSLLMRINEAIE